MNRTQTPEQFDSNVLAVLDGLGHGQIAGSVAEVMLRLNLTRLEAHDRWNTLMQARYGKGQTR